MRAFSILIFFLVSGSLASASFTEDLDTFQVTGMRLQQDYHFAQVNPEKVCDYELALNEVSEGNNVLEIKATTGKFTDDFRSRNSICELPVAKKITMNVFAVPGAILQEGFSVKAKGSIVFGDNPKAQWDANCMIRFYSGLSKSTQQGLVSCRKTLSGKSNATLTLWLSKEVASR